MASQNIKQVFKNTLESVRKGKMANISKEMRKCGYSESTARTVKITKTKTWQQCLAKIEDNKILDEFYKIAIGKKDLRAKIEAGKEIFKLKDRYPASKLKLGAFEDRDKVLE